MVCGQTNIALYDETPHGAGGSCVVCEEAKIYAEGGPLYQNGC